MILGIIPARAGSKGIPNKNAYPLCGKPLIEYTIDAVRESLLDDYLITTDSTEIFQYEKAIFRPLHLAEDKTPMLPVIQHALKEYGKEVEAVMILQPTSPLRTAEDINKALELYKKPNIHCLVSVNVGIHPKKTYKPSAFLYLLYACSCSVSFGFLRK